MTAPVFPDRVLVTGAGGPAGRSLLHQLTDRGLAVVALDMAECATAPDVPFYRVPAARDPQFVEVLRRIVHVEAVDLVIPTVTEELVVLAEGPVDVGAPLVLAPYEAVCAADDKFATARILHAAGVPVPATFGGSDLAGDDPGWLTARARLGTPWLSKPRSGRGGRGVQVHDEPATAADAVRAQRENLLWQEFAPGEEYAPNLYLAAEPADDVVVVLCKTELKHGRHGNAVGVERVDGCAHADAGAVALRAARAIGLRGPVDVDVRRRADGVPVVLEINARFGANSAHAPEVLDRLLDEYLGGGEPAAVGARAAPAREARRLS